MAGSTLTSGGDNPALFPSTFVQSNIPSVFLGPWHALGEQLEFLCFYYHFWGSDDCVVWRWERERERGIYGDGDILFCTLRCNLYRVFGSMQ